MAGTVNPDASQTEIAKPATSQPVWSVPGPSYPLQRVITRPRPRTAMMPISYNYVTLTPTARETDKKLAPSRDENVRRHEEQASAASNERRLLYQNS